MNDDQRKFTGIDWLLLCGMVALGASMRMIGDVANLQPIAAIALFAAFYYRSALIASLMVLAVMIPTAWFSGELSMVGIGYPWPIFLLTYASLLIPAAFGRYLLKRPDGTPFRFFGTVVGLSLSNSLLFFAITNFAFWKFQPIGLELYPHSLAGLGQAYIAGLPFLKAPLIADLVFSLFFFSTWYLISIRAAQKSTAKAMLTGDRK